MPAATASGPIRVAIAHGAPNIPKMIAPRLVLSELTASGMSFSNGVAPPYSR